MKTSKNGIDWMITLVPLILIGALSLLFFLMPEQSNLVLGQVRFFFGDTLGAFYIAAGLGIFLVSVYLCASKYGDIVLGDPGEKPKYSFFAWGSMMFTCGLAADILFYSFSEWVMYAANPHIAELGTMQQWAGVFPLFHWSFIPWAFYLVLAAAFGFMLHVRKRSRQRFSEACRPLLGKHTDGLAGRVIDLLAVFALLAGGQGQYIIETGIESFGRMVQNFIGLATYMDPLRTTNFAQDWTIYYWAYWMVWCVAAPFFIGSISRGRTVRQTIAGGYLFGVGSTLVSFIVFGNYSLGLQTEGAADFLGEYLANGDLYAMILHVLDTLPWGTLVMVWVLATMVAFYATSFDSIAYTAACYSYYRLEDGAQPHRAIQLTWCILLIVLPMALMFSESSMSNIQTVSILAAFPVGIIMLLIIWSFLKDAGKYLSERSEDCKT